MKADRTIHVRSADGDESMTRETATTRGMLSACNRFLAKRGVLNMCCICEKREAMVSARGRCNVCRRAGL